MLWPKKPVSTSPSSSALIQLNLLHKAGGFPEAACFMLFELRQKTLLLTEPHQKSY